MASSRRIRTKRRNTLQWCLPGATSVKNLGIEDVSARRQGSSAGRFHWKHARACNCTPIRSSGSHPVFRRKANRRRVCITLLKVAICARGIAALALIETNRDMNQRLQEQSARPAFGSSRKCVWLIVFTSSTRAWAEMHETAFGRGSIHKTPLTCGVFSSRTYSSEWTPLRGSMEQCNANVLRWSRMGVTSTEAGQTSQSPPLHREDQQVPAVQRHRLGTGRGSFAACVVLLPATLQD